MPSFTPEEQEKLKPYVTDPNSDIFAVKNLDGIVGAVYARYSRATGGFRETLLKEFIKEGVIDARHAQDLIERVLIAYGDDSVGELEGAHISFENISILATKEIEDRRIGGSPIEQSTRYVFYDKRDEIGDYRYFKPPEIMSSPHATAYTETMDFIFKTYCELIEPMKNFYEQLKPVAAAEYDINGDGVKEKMSDLKEEKDIKAWRVTYNADIRTKACDTLRALLPIATKTNVGIFGNGRFFQNVLTHCYSHPLPEAQAIAAKTHEALNQIIPRYVKRAKRQEYVTQNRTNMEALAKELFASVAPATEEPVILIDRGEENVARAVATTKPGDPTALRAALQEEEDNLLIALMLYSYLNHPLRQIRAEVRKMTPAAKEKIIAVYVGNRASRRDRPGRALEGGYPYTFDLTTDFGTYKDLMRHRMTTQLRQKFTPLLGFSMPPDLEEAGFAGHARECAERAAALYNRLLPDFPETASYSTLHGSLVRWVLGMNDREASHLLELRTVPQGHPSYRKTAQMMHRAIASRSKWRADILKFVDHNDYFWSRADSEARQRAKEAALKENRR